MKRRDFIKLGGVVGAGTLIVDGCNKPLKTAAKMVPEDVPIPGAEDWFPSVCTECAGGCGLLVRMVEGNARKVEGNPLHPINQGKTCARGQAVLQRLYNPDRLQRPLKQTGSRGDKNGWKEITWDEALNMVAGTLRALRQQEQAHALAFLTGALRGHMPVLIARFMGAYGSPNYIVHEPFGNAAVLLANQLNMGYGAFAAHDIENTNFLLSFGANFLETYRSPVRYNLGYGHMRQGRPGLRGRVVQVESRFSLTAANADEWLPSKPGAEGAVALAIAYVMIKENLYDKDFVAAQTHGFDAFKEAVLADYAPDKVAAYSEVPVEKIQAVARRFASTRPSLALGGDSAAAQTNGVTAMMAVNALNALVGIIGKPGGLFFDPPPPLAALPEAPKDAVAAKGLSMAPVAGDRTASVAERLLGGRPYPIQAMFLYETNPVFTEPGAAAFRKALQKIPFVVSFSAFQDESTALADLILPEMTPLERWVDDIPAPGIGIPTVTVAKPALKPLYKDTQATGDFLLTLAKNLGGDVAAALPWPTYAELLKASCQGLFQQKRGSVVEEDFESFWETLQQKGGWWDPTYKKDVVFKTPSGKFEFQPPAVSALHSAAAFEGDASAYPFHLHIYRSMALTDGRGANQPWLQELPDPMTSIAWNNWVEISAKDAQALGLKDDDWVWVESALGKIKLPVQIYIGTMPGVVNIPVGQGHETYGRYAGARGANPLSIVTRLTEPLSGASAWAATRVKITKAGGRARLARVGHDRVHTEGEHKRPIHV